MLDEAAEQRIVAAAEEAGRHCGLYASHIHIQTPPEEGDEEEEHRHPALPEGGPALVIVAYDVGDLALSPRTLDPQDEDTRAAFREIVTDEQREQVKKLKSEGMTGGLAELEADDPEGL